MKSTLTRRHSLGLLAAALPLAAQAQWQPEAGKHFRRLAQRLPSSGPKIEVVEFFWYGCPACNALEPHLQAWAKQLPANVEFKHSHIFFRENTRNHQRLFFTLEAMGVERQFRSAIFAAIHQQGQPMDTPEAVIKLLQPLGLDVARFNSTWAAFAPNAFSAARITQANKLAEAYRLEGVPTLGIGGQYITSPSMAAAGERMTLVESSQRALFVVDHLIRNFGKV